MKDYLDGGKLVPDELTSRVVEEMVIDKEQSYLLDGYPRTLGQAGDLAAMLAEARAGARLRRLLRPGRRGGRASV